jgi:hypothetical protein
MTWEGFSLLDVLDIPISLIALVGVFGYAYKRKIIGERFWQFWLFVAIGWDILVHGALEDFSDLGEISTIEIGIGLAVAALLILPQYIALYLYGFRSTALWLQRSPGIQA